MYSNQDNVVSFHPDKSFNNLPPQNIEAEEAILGGIMLDPEAIARVSDRLIAQAFYISAHKDIYQAATTPGQDCGAKCSALSTSVDQQSLSSKTQQGCSLEEWQQSSKTFPKSGTYVNGKLYPHTASACHMKEKECLSLPTPMAYSTVNSQPPGPGQTHLIN